MIEISAHQTGWPYEFRKLACVLRQGLDPLALCIDHIGSTSVPGLAAKDVIDIQISVAAFIPHCSLPYRPLVILIWKIFEAIIVQPTPGQQMLKREAAQQYLNTGELRQMDGSTIRLRKSLTKALSRIDSQGDFRSLLEQFRAITSRFARRGTSQRFTLGR